MLFVVLCPGTPEGSTGSGSGFKASQKTGQWLKVSSDRLEKPGIHEMLVHFFCLWPCSLAVPVLAGWVYACLWFFVQELPKAQLSVVLVLKRLRRRGNGLKSPTTDWEEPVTFCCLWQCSLAVPVLAGWVLWFYVQELPKAQPAGYILHTRCCFFCQC